MVAAAKETSIFQTILAEGLASKWLSIFFFLNAFLTGFLLPTDYFEAGYNSHHWDFVYAISGAISLYCFRRFFKNPTKPQLAICIGFSGLFAAFLPYLWAYLVLPHGIPESLESKWVYTFNGPAGQIVSIALLVGAIRYGQRVSNSVAENRFTLNHLRSNMKTQIDQEREEILTQLRSQIEPALKDVAFSANSGANRDEISNGINNVINQVVRPLSHNLDARAENISIELNRKDIKRDFRKKRFRRRLKGSIPLTLAFSAPLTYFAYINFNLSVISYLHGPLLALKIGAPFLIATAALQFIFNKLANIKEAKVYTTLVSSLLISFWQGAVFYFLTNLFKVDISSADNASFAFSTFFLTLTPAVFGIILFNMRANLDAETTLNNEIAHDLSTIRRQLWSIRKKLAREIHGGLQSKLQVLALQISKNLEPNLTYISSFYMDLETSLTLKNGEAESIDLQDYFMDLSEFWDGILSIKVDIETEVDDAFKNDYLIQECIQEVAREAVNNAVKHANSNLISITLKLIDSNTLQLVIKNNVNKVISETPTSRSLGKNIYKELSKSWDLHVGSEETTLSVNFALN